VQVKLFIGSETYEGAGANLKAAKQNAALQVRNIFYDTGFCNG
jgi:dsRNA-specific ribonuclease